MERPRSLAAAPVLAAPRLSSVRLSDVSAAQLVWALVGLGAGLRAARFALDRSLWLDEATLALNVADRPFTRLFGTLDFGTGAPPGFLVLQKLAVSGLGRSEYALRLLPFVCGLASLLLFAFLSRRLLRPWPAALAVALFALSEPLVDWGAQAKPYSGDVTAALLVTTAAVWLRSAPSRRRAAAFVAAAVVGLALSYPALFVLAAAVVYLAFDRRAAPVRAALGVSLAIVVGAAGVALTHTSSLARMVVRGDYAMPLGSRTPHWLGGSLAALVRIPVELPRWAVILPAALVVAGAVALWRRERPTLVLLVLPGAAALVLSVGLYPFGPRFVLFLTPAVLLLLAAGVPRRYGVAVAALLLAFPVGTAVARVLSPPRPEDVRPLLGQLRSSWRPGDRLFVNGSAQYAFRFYEEGRPGPWPIAPTGGTHGGSPALRSAPQLVIGAPWLDRPAWFPADLRRAGPRTWVLATHQSGYSEHELAATLDHLGTRIAAYRRPGAVLFLYDLRDYRVRR